MSLSLCKKRRQTSSGTSTVTCEQDEAQKNGKQNRKTRCDEANNVMEVNCETPMTSSQAKRLRRSESQQSQSHVVALSQSRISSMSQTLLSPEVVNCGKIHKITLVNFMCHANYCIELLPRMNFIVGSNGSGKSALLAALVIGMGARARNTNRSGSLHKLIKTGENSARVEITIWNDGPEAFSPELYGDKITVVRNITKGGNSYKLKSQSGHVISDKFSELERILEMHNIQVTNPAFVMNQDSAREFLKDMEPKKNYALFMKATQLDAIQEKLFKCQYEYEDHWQRLKFMKKKLESDKQLIRELELNHQRLLSYAKLKHEINKKELELEWAVVKQSEEELKVLEEALTATQKERDKLLTQAHRKNEIENEHKTTIQKYKETVNSKKTEYGEKNEYCQNIDKRLNIKAKRCHEIQYDIDACKKRISYLETQIIDLQKYIDESSNKMGVAELRRRNDAQLVDLQSKLKDVKAITASAGRDHEIFIEDKAQKEDTFTNVKQQIHNIMQAMDNRRSEISNLTSNKKNQLSIYGEHMQQISQEIQRYYNAGKFSQLPLGPLGKFIEVPNAKYRDVVESQIGNLLRGFVVNDTKDRIQLNAILRNFPNNHIMVITTKFSKKVYDVRSGCVKPPSGTRVLFDVIRCAEPVVMNCLIDHLKIETILLAENKDIAENITMHQRNVPKNLMKVIVLQPCLEYYPDPNYRMYSLKMRPARYIQVNVDARISQLNAELVNMEAEKQDLAAKSNACATEVREITSRLREKQAMLQKHKEECLLLEQRITELENFEYPVSNEIDICQKELADNQRECEIYKQKLIAKKREYADAANEKNTVETELKEHKNKLSQIQQEIKYNENKENELEMRLHSMLNNFQKYEDRIKHIEERLQAQEEEKNKKMELVDKLTKDALKRGLRQESNRSPGEISDELKLRKAQLKQGAPLDDDPTRLEQDVDRKKHTLSTDQSTFNISELFVQKLSQSLRRRFNFIKSYKRHMVTMLQHTFSSILNKRSLTGTIRANHQDQTLEILVIPRDNHISDAVSNTRALSGGERSYTTVAFLISLWSCVDHPFFFLDEYDVFADEVNREYMTRLLMHEGKNHPNRQFALLTPQDMSVAASNYIRIHRLAHPNRR